MKLQRLLVALAGVFIFSLGAVAQPVTCPAPTPSDPNCYQTSRPNGGNPINNSDPIPNQDCCNAIPLCSPTNNISNGAVIPLGATSGVLFPGCVEDELPEPPVGCFSNNEKGTTWYKFKIRPLPFGSKAFGAPAGKLRFRIIPQDALDLPTYDPDAFDPGSAGIGNTDYDFLLFDITAACSDGEGCGLIKNTTDFGQAGSIIKSCNWTGTKGPTGLFEPGTGTEAAQGPATRFNKPLDVTVGQVFMLAIDNFSVNDQGFVVDFRPNSSTPDTLTAIVNPPPATDSIRIKSITNPACNDTLITITFTSPIRTDSVAASSFEVIGLNGPYTLTPINSTSDCFGVEDTTFTFGVYPSVPDTTLQLVIKNEIRDICGNKVLVDTIPFRIPYPKIHRHSFAMEQPVCDIAKINIRLNEKVLCNTVMVPPYNKFRIVSRVGIDSANVDTSALTNFCDILNITRTNGNACGPKTMDSLYTLTLSRQAIDTMHLAIYIDSLNGSTIKDSCQGYLRKGFIPFDILPVKIPMQITGSASCGIPRLAISFGTKLLCDSVKPSKFVVLLGNNEQGVVSKVERQSGDCQAGVLDSLYVLTLSKPIVEPQNLKLVLSGIIRDKCGNPAFFDTLSFKVNPFLTVIGEEDTVCPGLPIKLKASPDSTFKTIAGSLWYTWKDLTTGDTLKANGSSVIFQGEPNLRSLVFVKKDTVNEEIPVTYRLYARHTTNGCVDSTDIPVLFSPKPDVNNIDLISLCYGEQLRVKPVVNNGAGKRLNNFDFTWSRAKGNNFKGVSSDSVLIRVINDTILALDTNNLVHDYKLDMSFKQKYGGCKAQTKPFKVFLAKRISPSIAVPPGDTLASIIPADFTFLNNSMFYPSKNSALFTYNFGDDEPEENVYGNAAVPHRYNLAGKYSIRITGYDTVYTSTTTIGRICTNSDSVQIEVQNLIPSLVTANGDRVNDLFEIEGMRANTFSAKVYNRWGKKILDQDPYDNKYDPGANLEAGVYYYILVEKRSGKSLVGWFQVTH